MSEQILKVLVKYCKECIWPTVYTSDAKDSPPVDTAQGQDSTKK